MLTFEPLGSGGLCVVTKGVPLCEGSTEIINFGQETATRVDDVLCVNETSDKGTLCTT